MPYFFTPFLPLSQAGRRGHSGGADRGEAGRGLKVSRGKRGTHWKDGKSWAGTRQMEEWKRVSNGASWTEIITGSAYGRCAEQVFFMLVFSPAVTRQDLIQIKKCTEWGGFLSFFPQQWFLTSKDPSCHQNKNTHFHFNNSNNKAIFFHRVLLIQLLIFKQSKQILFFQVIFCKNPTIYFCVPTLQLRTTKKHM